MLAKGTVTRYVSRTMKNLSLALTLAAFACVSALQAGEEIKACDAAKAKPACTEAAKACCPATAKATSCEKEAFAKKITMSPKATELAKK